MACHVVVPEAVPVRPFEVCHLTRVTPVPADAVPLSESVDPVTETTGEIFESIERLTGWVAGSWPKAIVARKRIQIFS